MIARKFNISNSYELLKNASRGKNIGKSELHIIINKLNISDTDKKKLLKLKPSDYIGLASKLCNEK